MSDDIINLGDFKNKKQEEADPFEGLKPLATVHMFEDEDGEFIARFAYEKHEDETEEEDLERMTKWADALEHYAWLCRQSGDPGEKLMCQINVFGSSLVTAKTDYKAIVTDAQFTWLDAQIDMAKEAVRKLKGKV